ncbi:MAG: hypothetical protein JST16_08520 [Bdellovibrionales bacterium]|nr:hypothetical protein [Bdellovibrionales bacterium]
MSDTHPCDICGGKKAPFDCGICAKHVCKSCLEYIDTNSFDFMSHTPPELTKGNYCPVCFEEKIVPARAEYDALMEKAADVYFLTRAYPGYVHVLRRHTKRVNIPECDDRRETIMRMAFLAAELGFNAIIDAEVKSFKVHKNSRKSALWTGSAVPAQIDGEQLERTSLKRL